MRYVPINCVREGMVVGRKLLGKNGELLLNTGATIRLAYLDKIRELGYGGLYIEDDLSRDIEIIEVISEDLRYKAVKTVKEAFIGTAGKTSYVDTQFDSISGIVENIVDDVIENRDTMVNMMDLKTFDDYTYLHSTNVAVLSIILGVSLRFSKIELQRLGLAAILHDIGKVFIPREILNKPTRLTEDEFKVMQTHSGRGYEYLKINYDFPMASYLGVLQHHEKFDGTGYPIRLGGNHIHLFGRIIAIADVYDALTSTRPYRKAMVPSEAIEYVMANGGNHFDPSIVDYFTRKIAPYPVGMTVKLSNNMSGIVMENYSDSSLRPKIKIIKRAEAYIDPYVMNLRTDANTRNITIIGMDEEIQP